MKQLLWVGFFAMISMLAACDKHSTTSSGSGGVAEVQLAREVSVTVAPSLGAFPKLHIVYVNYEERGVVGTPIKIEIKMRRQLNITADPLSPFPVDESAPGSITGTIHWGDGSSERVRDGMKTSHSYAAEGVYTFAIQIDGEEKVSIGPVFILQPGVSREVPFNRLGGFLENDFGSGDEAPNGLDLLTGFACRVAGAVVPGDGTLSSSVIPGQIVELRLPSPFSGGSTAPRDARVRFISQASTCLPSEIPRVIVLPGNNVSSLTTGCSAGDIAVAELEDIVTGQLASCKFLVVDK
jgi:hypothetical protein